MLCISYLLRNSRLANHKKAAWHIFLFLQISAGQIVVQFRLGQALRKKSKCRSDWRSFPIRQSGNSFLKTSSPSSSLLSPSKSSSYGFHNYHDRRRYHHHHNHHITFIIIIITIIIGEEEVSQYISLGTPCYKLVKAPANTSQYQPPFEIKTCEI